MTNCLRLKSEVICSVAASCFNAHKLTLDGGRVDVGVLGGGAVAPDDAAGHVLDVAAALDGKLAHGAVVVKAGKGGEVLCLQNNTIQDSAIPARSAKFNQV